MVVRITITTVKAVKMTIKIKRINNKQEYIDQEKNKDNNNDGNVNINNVNIYIFLVMKFIYVERKKIQISPCIQSIPYTAYNISFSFDPAAPISLPLFVPPPPLFPIRIKIPR